MSRFIFAALAAATLAGHGAPAAAGPLADELARCLVSSSTAKDKTDLARWVFSNAALHPDVASISAADAALRTRIDTQAGALLQRLLTESCRKQTQAALRGEGPMALQASFQALGQSAMQELIANPAVAQGFAGTLRYVDQTRLLELLIPGR